MPNVKNSSMLPLRPNWLSKIGGYCAAFGGHPHQSKIGSEEPIFDSLELWYDCRGQSHLCYSAEGGSSTAYRLWSSWANSVFLKFLTLVNAPSYADTRKAKSCFTPIRIFGNIHKSAPNVLASLHTFLINNLLIFNFFSFIMNIETEQNHFRSLFVLL